MDQFREWLKEICRLGEIGDFVNTIKGEGSPTTKGESVYIYTRTNQYYIVSKQVKGEKGYLGCQVSSRKPRAGEDWTRGNDLPDGPFCRETWEKIKGAIIAYELVKIAKSPKPTRSLPNIPLTAPGSLV